MIDDPWIVDLLLYFLNTLFVLSLLWFLVLSRTWEIPLLCGPTFLSPCRSGLAANV